MVGHFCEVFIFVFFASQEPFAKILLPTCKANKPLFNPWPTSIQQPTKACQRVCFWRQSLKLSKMLCKHRCTIQTVAQGLERIHRSRKLKPQKFLKSEFWPISRKFVPAKITNHTVALTKISVLDTYKNVRNISKKFCEGGCLHTPLAVPCLHLQHLANQNTTNKLFLTVTVRQIEAAVVYCMQFHQVTLTMYVLYLGSLSWSLPHTTILCCNDCTLQCKQKKNIDLLCITGTYYIYSIRYNQSADLHAYVINLAYAKWT